MLARRSPRNASAFLQHHVRHLTSSQGRERCEQRNLITLAIETSCDDTSVAIAELLPSASTPRLKVHFHDKVTASQDGYSGIHPLVALRSHQTSLAPLLLRALETSPKPDLVAATRGPGMRSNLSVGLDTAKGLALAWGVPFVGVHHMQAHALTPRLVAAMKSHSGFGSEGDPGFPFLSVLASGGHTTLINSKSLVEHSVLAETQDIALGDCLDKAARAILPPDLLRAPYGLALEKFAFPSGNGDYDYSPPKRRGDELQTHSTKWDWALRPPLSESKGGIKTSRRMAYSFAGLLSSVERFLRSSQSSESSGQSPHLQSKDISLEERRDMAKEIQRVAFEHLASRILLHLSVKGTPQIGTIVVSGGVASNSYLRHVLRSILDIRGFRRYRLEFPPVHLCTDNALMIAWAAIEMWQAGYLSDLDVSPIRKWSMDPEASDGGIIGVGGWRKLPSRVESAGGRR